MKKYFNPRSPRGERQSSQEAYSDMVKISIHAPREGSDGDNDNEDNDSINISIHAPREGSDIKADNSSQYAYNFNPRSPRGERHRVQETAKCNPDISIHAPREGSDQPRQYPFIRDIVFQSTLPARGATKNSFHRSPRCLYFNPRSPRGERPLRRYRVIDALYIFQSTLPARGATVQSKHAAMTV